MDDHGEIVGNRLVKCSTAGTRYRRTSVGTEVEVGSKKFIKTSPYESDQNLPEEEVAKGLQYIQYKGTLPHYLL